ncbi:MAG: PilZ domain-containing protein [Phycisphaeraceae bacterium]|nr:PilZ domain-containing protein [Phycisphaeraceae bacterium]
MTQMQTSQARRMVGFARAMQSSASIAGPWEGSMKLDRRRAVRMPATGGLLATWRDGRGRMGLVSLDLVDVSDGGLGVTSPRGITIGARLTLRDRTEAGAWGDAVVVRRRREGQGWRLGLRLGSARAA